MRKTRYLVIGALLLVALLTSAPAASAEDPVEKLADCVNVSVDPPGAAVDPLCLIHPEPEPGP